MVSRGGFTQSETLVEIATKTLRALGIVVTPLAVAAAIWLLLD